MSNGLFSRTGDRFAYFACGRPLGHFSGAFLHSFVDAVRVPGVLMLKHRGFPGRLPGSDYQFVIRRANPKGVTPITRRERFADRRGPDREADRGFLGALVAHFGEVPFERGNLDAGRLSWLFGREVVAVDDPFDPRSYDAMLRVDLSRAEASFPELFDASMPAGDPDDDEWA